ncbi:uncharacterized protein LOC105849027 [Hydra vulgaris]|uniref:uncharacterized protein LOC105849027 n=1 Tax=Hydra vulgaris TaxID=6087 RepID=UPI0006412E30|nr:uncharacterized protein LOC105849027 isoform X2 [Hydra vulgaris]
MSNQLIARLSRVGGTTLKENIKNILESLMSYKVMAGFNMKGNNRNEKNKQEVQDKLSFEKLKFFELIIESILTKRSEATISDIKAEVQKILRYAPSKVVVKDGGLLPKDHIET